MRIIANCKNTFDAHVEPGDSQELRNIAMEILPEWLALFAAKNRDYGNNAQELGLRGQFADIWRKIAKLKRSMWDGDELLFENTEEVIMDLIGHLFLSLNMLRLRDEAERVYAYSEDDAAVDAFFRMAGLDPRVVLYAASVLQPPFRELVQKRAEEMIAADLAEEMQPIRDKLFAEKMQLRPLGTPPVARARGTEDGTAAQDGASEARYEAYDEPVVADMPLGGDFWTDFVTMSGLPVQWEDVPKEEQAAAFDAGLDSLKVRLGLVNTGGKLKMSVAEWLYRRHGDNDLIAWSDLPPKDRKVWEIEAKAVSALARRS